MTTNGRPAARLARRLTFILFAPTLVLVALCAVTLVFATVAVVCHLASRWLT